MKRRSASRSPASFGCPLWYALHGLEPYVVLVSDTACQALKFLGAIKLELEENDALRRAYPALARKGPVWRNNEIGLANGVALEALAGDGKLRGRNNRARRPSPVPLVASASRPESSEYAALFSSRYPQLSIISRPTEVLRMRFAGAPNVLKPLQSCRAVSFS